MEQSRVSHREDIIQQDLGYGCAHWETHKQCLLSGKVASLMPSKRVTRKHEMKLGFYTMTSIHSHKASVRDVVCRTNIEHI